MEVRTRIPQKPTIPSVPTLAIVPRKDLALQLARWIQVIIESNVRSVYLWSRCWLRYLGNLWRTSWRHWRTRRAPNSDWDATGYFELRQTKDKLNAVVVDEADYLTETAPNLSDKFKREKMRKKITNYPNPTRQLLNKILEPCMIKPDDPDADNAPTSNVPRDNPKHTTRHNSFSLPPHSITALIVSRFRGFRGVVG